MDIRCPPHVLQIFSKCFTFRFMITFASCLVGQSSQVKDIPKMWGATHNYHLILRLLFREYSTLWFYLAFQNEYDEVYHDLKSWGVQT
jgi:hypothetical protein